VHACLPPNNNRQMEHQSKLTLGLLVGSNDVGYSVGKGDGRLVGGLVGYRVVGGD
jgi:hypothetical protein